ncbi:MAG: hypothetical protein ACREFQ_16635, partial [Stellaceae bacterium]
ELLARAKVLKDLVAHHVEEEESRGFPRAKRLFDEDALEKLDDDFEREKERLARPARPRRAAAEPAYAGGKPRKAAKTKRSPRAKR